MTTTSERPIPASSPDLPPVERRAAIPPGFRAGGLAAGIKASGRPDLAVVVTTAGPAAAAAVFTPNTFAAAPVRLSKAHLAATSGDARGGFGWAEAIISTSGSANAATGAAGDADQVEIAAMLAAATGRRGRADAPPLDRDHRDAAAAQDGPGRASATLVPTLSRRADDGLLAAAEALRTTDSVVKVATTSVELPDDAGRPVRVTVSGIAKGVGMIHPRMATMLSVVLTDAAVAPEVLWGLLRPAAARTWDQLSVDGDTSTNDTVFVLASGDVGGRAGGGRFRRQPASSAPRSRRSRGTSRASRRPTARARARSSRRP